MTDTQTEFLSIGGVADRMGVSRSAVRRWEEIGIIPPAARLTGSDRRVYRVVDLETIQTKVAEMRAAGRRRGDPERAA